MNDTTAPARGRPRKEQSQTVIMMTMSDEERQMIKANNEWIEAQRKSGVVTDQRWMNSTNAAKHINVSRIHLVKNLKKEIGYSILKSRMIFDRNDLDKYLEARKIYK